MQQSPIVSDSNITGAQKPKTKPDPITPYFNFRRVKESTVDLEMVQEIFRLRYEVYCVERNFLPAEDFADGLEIDEFDDSSIHFAAYNMDDAIVGSVRLVRPGPDQHFPFEQHCPVFDTLTLPPQDASGEISRLVVNKTYRRRRGDSLQGISKEFMDKNNAAIRPSAGGNRRSSDSPQLLLGMYREMYRYSRANGVRYWYAAMERSLAFSLRKMGFKFVPIGPATDYYGPVTPFMVDLDQLNGTLRKENPLLAAWFNDEPISIWLRVGMWLKVHMSFWKR